MAGFLQATELAALAKDLKSVDPVMRKALPKRLREAAKPIADEAKINAASVSPHIRIGTRVKLNSRRGASVKVIGTSPANPPIAGLEERGNKGSSDTSHFTHPVFGKGTATQPTHPYIQPALDAHRAQAVDAMSKVLDDVSKHITH